MEGTNEKTKYLYGASVQGIQDFIFQTNDLKDIIGASGLVENACKHAFEEFVGKGNWLVKAAGNIKCIYTSGDECKAAVKNFPKKVMEMAPGITISQAVVEYKSDFKTAVEKLEKYLTVQRNMPAHSLTLGLMGIVRSRKTGLPAIKYVEKIPVDEATDKQQSASAKEFVKTLCKKCLGDGIDYPKIAFDIDKMTLKNDWIAIIHADGNGFGKIIQAIGTDCDKLKSFSEILEDVTQQAAQLAFKAIETKFDKNDNIPVRPIILGGDDLTIICRADLAIKYTEKFMQHFESKSEELLKDGLKEAKLKKLTTCAGIAFIKSSYPFYYGYDLAEKLCDEAKKEAKGKPVDGLAPSCLMFHKVKDSFIENYETIVKRELTTRDGVSFQYGPYYLSETMGKEKTITSLMNNTAEIKEKNALKSHFRQWISLLFTNPEMAKQKITRMKEIFNDDVLIDKITALNGKKTPAYDVLSLYSVMHQETKNKNIIKNGEGEND
jgi:hypothetical protein